MSKRRHFGVGAVLLSVTVSYGKEQPIGRDYAQNRNGHLVIVSDASGARR